MGLKQTIISAFKNETFDFGLGLESAYARAIGESGLGQMDKHNNWQQLAKYPETLDKCIEVSLRSFSDGFKFHLALYMYLFVKSGNELLAMRLYETLCDLRQHNMLILRSLNITQRQCVGAVLEHLNEVAELEGHQKCINKMAIDDFWLADLPEHSSPLHQDPDQIRKLIKKAFKGVELEDGTSLHETIYHDNYGMVSKKVLRQMEEDERYDWEKLVDDPELYLVSGIGGICFYDDKGFKFHLPAYMCLGLKNDGLDVIEELVFTLARIDEYSLERIELLTADQRHCATLFLKYLRDTSIHFPPGMLPDINEALCAYWCKS